MYEKMVLKHLSHFQLTIDNEQLEMMDLWKCLEGELVGVPQNNWKKSRHHINSLQNSGFLFYHHFLESFKYSSNFL